MFILVTQYLVKLIFPKTNSPFSIFILKYNIIRKIKHRLLNSEYTD